jgi:hypothetical protein
MKSLGILLLFSTLLNTASTTNYSLYFHSDFLPKTIQLKTVPANLYGEFELEERHENDLRAAAGNKLIVNEKGILLEKNKLLSISKTEVRENGKYLIRDGYLHGILEGDSLPAFLDDDRYYFLMPSAKFLFDPLSGQKMVEGGKKDEFLIFSESPNDSYSLLAVWFKNNTVQLRELDALVSKFDFTSLEHERISADDAPETLILKPSEADWEEVIGELRTYDKYVKLEE